MSFFKELKEDIVQSLDELGESMDDAVAAPEEKPEEPVQAEAVLSEEPAEEKTPEPEMPEASLDIPVEKAPDETESLLEELEEMEEKLPDVPVEEFTGTEKEEEPAADKEPAVEEEPAAEEVPAAESEPQPESEPQKADVELEKENEQMKGENTMSLVESEMTSPIADDENSSEVTVITKGTTISGGIKSDTSLVVKGTIEGDVECQGKLTITGRVAGNTIASEIYVNTPRLEGDINSKGIVKIDVGTVVIGNVNCTSVVVAGAVKGNITVDGPVVIDSTAVVMGNVKAKSIQLNSGAVIDGHCSLQFADVDLDTFFE